MRKEVRSQLFIDYNPDYKASILLAGAGRGGTTWVSDIINYNNEYRYVFEPFHPSKGPACVRTFGNRQYLRPENSDQKFVKPALSVLSGRARSWWSDRYNRKRIANKRLVKDIRLNLMLKWIHANFSGIPIVLLFRHPCAVTNSRLKQKWDTYLEDILVQEDLMNDFLNPFRKEIREAKNDFEKHLFLWCIETYVPLQQFKEGEIHLAFYENFLVEPEQEISRLFSYLGKDYDETVLENLAKPSATGKTSRLPPNRREIVDSWRADVSDKQIKRATEILSLFRLDSVYTQDSLPVAESAYKPVGAR